MNYSQPTALPVKLLLHIALNKLVYILSAYLPACYVNDSQLTLFYYSSWSNSKTSPTCFAVYSHTWQSYMVKPRTFMSLLVCPNSHK